MAQLGYAQEKSLSTQITQADGPVATCTGEVIIYSTHACRWPSWDMNKWTHYLLNSRMQMAQLGYAQEKSLSTQLTHADGPVGICTGEVLIYSTHACRWPSWDMQRRNHYLLNSRKQMAQLRYVKMKSLSTQLTHADGPVGICTSEVIIYSTHACIWRSCDMNKWTHYLLMTHACRWPSWDMHRRSHYLLNSRMQMAQLGYAPEKSLSTQLTHADGTVGICKGEIIIYSTHASRLRSCDM